MTAVTLQWGEILKPLLQKYKLNITWGDQDLLNIIFHHNPGMCDLIIVLFIVSHMLGVSVVCFVVDCY